jgi:hypothetical protein
MASDSVVADAALLPETVQVPESDDELTSLTAAPAVSKWEGESAAGASDATAPELIEFRRKRTEALEHLRALYELPEAEGTFEDFASTLAIAAKIEGSDEKVTAGSEDSSSSTAKNVTFADGAYDKSKGVLSIDLEDERASSSR